MHKARWARAVSFRFVCLLFLSTVLTGCGGLLTGQLSQAEDTVAAGKPFKGDTGVNDELAPPEVVARKKIALAMNILVKGDSSSAEAKQLLKSVQKDPYLEHEITVEAGYLLTLMDKLEARQKELEHQRQRLDKCQKDKEDMGRDKEQLNKDKDEVIAGLIKERDDLAFKLKKLEEIYNLTEKRRGIRR